MSSFVGHALTALTIGKVFEKNITFRQEIFWQICLVLCAFAPDIDYIVPVLNKSNNSEIRLTHSIPFSLILPVILMVFVFIFDRKNLVWKGISACLAGLSHLVLDLLVGSLQVDPLFYPFSGAGIGLPFGLLPSAGRISLINYYFYRNMLIEEGILIPIFVIFLWFFGKIIISKFTLSGLLIVFFGSLIWSISLVR